MRERTALYRKKITKYIWKQNSALVFLRFSVWTLQSTTCYVTRALVHLEKDKLAQNRQVHNSNGWFSVQSKMKKTIQK